MPVEFCFFSAEGRDDYRLSSGLVKINFCEKVPYKIELKGGRIQRLKYKYILEKK